MSENREIMLNLPTVLPVSVLLRKLFESEPGWNSGHLTLSSSAQEVTAAICSR